MTMKALGRICIAAAAFAFPHDAAAGVPLFRLPLSAKVVQRDGSGDSWRENGCVNAPFAAAVGQFDSALARDNWRFVRRIDLSQAPERSLFVWRRGASELTLMLWREAPGRTGFSWGVSVQAGNTGSPA